MRVRNVRLFVEFFPGFGAQMPGWRDAGHAAPRVCGVIEPIILRRPQVAASAVRHQDEVKFFGKRVFDLIYLGMLRLQIHTELSKWRLFASRPFGNSVDAGALFRLTLRYGGTGVLVRYGRRTL
jgi:hypothetical protein